MSDGVDRGVLLAAALNIFAELTFHQFELPL